MKKKCFSAILSKKCKHLAAKAVLLTQGNLLFYGRNEQVLKTFFGSTSKQSFPRCFVISTFFFILCLTTASCRREVCAFVQLFGMVFCFCLFDVSFIISGLIHGMALLTGFIVYSRGLCGSGCVCMHSLWSECIFL